MWAGRGVIGKWGRGWWRGVRGGRTDWSHLLPGCWDEELLPPARPGLLWDSKSGTLYNHLSPQLWSVLTPPDLWLKLGSMRLTISAGIGYISYTPMENPCLGLCLTWAITPGLTGKGCMGGAWVTMGTEYPAGWLRLPLEKTAQSKPLVNYAPQQGHGQIHVISVERWDHAFKVRHFVLKQTE